MALLWAKMSTGQPLRVRSARRKNGPITECELDIDIHKNVPRVLRHVQVPNPGAWQGTDISVVIQGAWSTYKAKLLSYMRQLAVITPYARFELRYTAPDPQRNLAVLYPRRADCMPPPPHEVKHHPASVDLIVLKRLVQYALLQCNPRPRPLITMRVCQLLIAPCAALCICSEAAGRRWTLKHTLRHQFAAIDAKRADAVCAALGADPATPAADLTDAQITRLRDVFAATTFPAVDGACLSPAGEYNLRLGVMKELRPEMVATWQEPAHVFEGHPFIVEAAVSLGGKAVQPVCSPTQPLVLLRPPRHAPPCHAPPRPAMPRPAMPRPRHAMPRPAMPCHAAVGTW
jgi:DNA topoisomerase VI subunit B